MFGNFVSIALIAVFEEGTFYVALDLPAKVPPKLTISQLPQQEQLVPRLRLLGYLPCKKHLLIRLSWAKSVFESGRSTSLTVGAVYPVTGMTSIEQDDGTRRIIEQTVSRDENCQNSHLILIPGKTVTLERGSLAKTALS